MRGNHIGNRPDGGPVRLAEQAAEAVLTAFDRYHSEYKAITRRAKKRFERRDWHAAQADTLERLDLYKKIVDSIVAQSRSLLSAELQNRTLWSEMRSHYRGLVSRREDIELAETFFNSVTRRVFTTSGVDTSIEFVDFDFELPDVGQNESIFIAYRPREGSYSGTAEVAAQILDEFAFETGYLDLKRDAAWLAGKIDRTIRAKWGPAGYSQIEMLRPVFYRGNGAYLIGRMCRKRPLQPGEMERPGKGTSWVETNRLIYTPLVISLVSLEKGVEVDAVLMDEDEVSIVFSFTRSYFHVEVDRPREVVLFLKSIMPLKRIAELYISLGYNKHGKTEFYRDLIHHLGQSTDQFEIARGERGMVMLVFTVPSYDVVFKVIKDKVDAPKSTSRQEVMERYELVFKHDRAGRLVDAQEFEHLSFERNRFEPALLEELQQVAPSQVTVSDDCVVIHHLYIERRLTPLNLYIREVTGMALQEAVIDYGQSIKDLAATNIFPGDVLLKNFGVTRHGRVVFYDYDELCLLTDCHFRRMPVAQNYDDEMSSEPWFYVGPLDIFPEEFETFLGLPEPLRSIFLDAHADLFGAEYWREMQSRHRAGEVVEIVPYPDSKRLMHEQHLAPSGHSPIIP